MPNSSNAILLHGTDEFAINAHLSKLRAGMGDPSIAELNISQFDGRAGLDFEALNIAVNAIPFLSARRLVVLRNPTAAFPARPQKQATPGEEHDSDVLPSANRKKFLELLAHIPPTTTLAIVEYESLKDDHWLLKWVHTSSGQVRILACSRPSQEAMSGWIQQETKKQGGRIEQGAALLLAEMVGEETPIAAQEITKLLTYVNYTRPVTAMDVEQVSIVSGQGSIFDLVDALGTGDGKKAQKILHQLLENGDPFSLWGMVIRQFRLLLLAREGIEARASMQEIERTLGVKTFVAKKACDQARRFTRPTLEQIYHRLLAIDEGVKTGQIPLVLGLDTLVMELAGRGAN